MNELREELKAYLELIEPNKRNPKLEVELFETIQSQPINKESQADRDWLDNQTEIARHLKSKIKELEKENEHLKQVYEHRCNEVKDKVETIHKYLNQITQLQKKVEEKDEIIRQALIYCDELNPIFKPVIESLTDKTDEI